MSQLSVNGDYTIALVAFLLMGQNTEPKNNLGYRFEIHNSTLQSAVAGQSKWQEPETLVTSCPHTQEQGKMNLLFLIGTHLDFSTII